MAKLADARDLGSRNRKVVEVQVLSGSFMKTAEKDGFLLSKIFWIGLITFAVITILVVLKKAP